MKNMGERKLKTLRKVKSYVIEAEWINLMIGLLIASTVISFILELGEVESALLFLVAGWGLSFIIPSLLSVYMMTKYPIEMKHYDKLPINLASNKAWKDIMDAFEVGKGINLAGAEELFESLQGNLFKTDVYTSLYKDKDIQNIVRDTKNSVLWTTKLIDSGLMSKVAFLLNLGKDGKIETFNDLGESELKDFVESFKEFSQYVKEVHTNQEFRASELKRRNVDKELVEEVELMYAYTKQNFNHREQVKTA